MHVHVCACARLCACVHMCVYLMVDAFYVDGFVSTVRLGHFIHMAFAHRVVMVDIGLYSQAALQRLRHQASPRYQTVLDACRSSKWCTRWRCWEQPATGTYPCTTHSLTHSAFARTLSFCADSSYSFVTRARAGLVD